MQTRAGHRRAPLALLAALLTAFAALLLPHAIAPADAAPSCPIDDPLCNDTTVTTPTTIEHLPTSSTIFRSTTTTDFGDETSTTDREASSTTVHRASTATTAEATTSTLTITTLHNVLIPGDGTAGAESTTTTSVALATGSSGLSDNQLILIIVTGLGIFAVAVGVLTWRYWSATRPRIVETPSARTGRSVFLD